MAPNKFATMVHVNTNKISLILVYTVLEWILIVLLLLNSLFSYLIIKFAEYFGLKPPCLWCTRLDHVFDIARRDNDIRKDLICEAHCKEISRLGYCLNHGKLVESREMCGDCSSGRPVSKGLSQNADLFARMKDLGVVEGDEEKVNENGEVCLKCSCCGICLDYENDINNNYASYILLKTSSWDVLKCNLQKNLIIDDNYLQESCDSDKKLSGFGVNLRTGEKFLEDKSEGLKHDQSLKVTENELINGVKEEANENVDVVSEMEGENENLLDVKSPMITNDKTVQVCCEEDCQVEVSSPHLEFFLDSSGHKLVPIELVNSIEDDCGKECIEIDDHNGIDVREVNSRFLVEKKDDFARENLSRLVEVDDILDVEIREELKFAGVESMESEEIANENVQFTTFDESQGLTEFASGFQEVERVEWEKHSYVITASQDVTQLMNNENEADISIGTEIPDLDITDEIPSLEQNLESVNSHEPSSTSLFEVDPQCSMQVEQQMVKLNPLSVQERDAVMTNQPPLHSELYEIEEEKVPDTPTSVESPNHLHTKLLLLAKKNYGAEESLDGSVTSEKDGSDGIITMERLKAVLRAERKNLQTLYSELEEERSASAVAANQTMAMINRLQEEKAAMQMEALQYQRMMDEQSEYDLEALELLNELMVKREKEKLELGKELEVCRKKLLDYETKEKLRTLKRRKDGSNRSGFSSASCSNGEESDVPSLNLNQDAKEDEAFYCHQEFTYVETAANLEESLADFDEERFSILKQLKFLEERIIPMDDDGDDVKHYFDNTGDKKDCQQENGNNHFNVEENGHSNEFFMNGDHTQRTVLQKGKSLLPLFEAICDENVDGVLNSDANGIRSNDVHDTCYSKLRAGSTKVSIEEEVDHLYQRLQAFEADREFLKHCISSLNKGEKGMDLLQEILQHLRDLRNVELRARNATENSLR